VQQGWLASFCRDTRLLGIPSLDKEGKPRPLAAAGWFERSRKAKSVAGSQRVAPPLCRCAPHPLLNRGGEFCCNLSVSQQKLLDPNQPDPFIVQRCTFPKIGGASLQKGIGAASIPVVSTLGDDGNIPALLRIVANSHSHRAND
jgi:hypothetical protein